MTLSRYIRLLEMKRKQNNNLRFNSSWEKKVQQNAVFKENYPLVLLVIFFVIFMFLVYFLPDNLLTNYPKLRQYVDFMAALFPSVNGYMKYSAFPQIAAFTFAIGIMLCVLATYINSFLLIPPPSKSIRHEVKGIIACLIIATFLIYFIYSFPDGQRSAVTRRGKMIEHALDSRVIFCTINAVFLWMTSVIFIVLYQRIRIILNYFYQLMRK